MYRDYTIKFLFKAKFVYNDIKLIIIYKKNIKKIK